MEEIRGELADPPAAPPKGSSDMENLIKRYSEEVVFERMSPDDVAQKFIAEANTMIAG